MDLMLVRQEQRKIWAWIFFFTLNAMMVAATTQKVILDIPGGVVINGKNITVTGIQGNGVNLDVDGVTEYVEDNKTTLINGATIYVYGLSRSPPRVIMDITVNIVCGDGACGIGEDSTICCADCGCLSAAMLCQGNRCIENITRSGAKNECFVDADCADADVCTTATCEVSAYPNKCVFQELAACISGDGCCPKSCDAPEDQDCAVVDKCTQASDCDDKNPCTTEECAGTPKRCAVTTQQGCPTSNACAPEGTVNQGRYCLAATNAWIDQKQDSDACKEDYECLSLSCTLKKCGEGKRNLFPKLFIGVLILVVLAGLYYVYAAVRKESG
ncbi:MAG: hypothetical protein AABW64_00205 [Nanoarchaeota archaeon]